jgi:hypothetical protein
MKNQPGRSVTTLWPVALPKKVADDRFGSVSSMASGSLEGMKLPHLRPSGVSQSLYDGQVPAGQARALHRRRVLEAQQRAFRDLEAGRPAASAADLAPVRRRAGTEGPAR